MESGCFRKRQVSMAAKASLRLAAPMMRVAASRSRSIRGPVATPCFSYNPSISSDIASLRLPVRCTCDVFDA